MKKMSASITKLAQCLAVVAACAASPLARAQDASLPLIGPPGADPLVVEIVVTQGATLLDFAGPAEAFGVSSSQVQEYLVGEDKAPIKLQNGVVVVPDYTFDTAPAPDIVIIGSQQHKASAKAAAWLKRQHQEDHVVMSVCTGADWLAQAGLLDGLQATTHHNAFKTYRRKYPSVSFVDGKRYVQADAHLYTSGGYTAGLDLALHIIDQRLGRDAAQKVANRLEYTGTAWLTNTGWPGPK
jgi:transcriptional regulator GlxA family with amidase domain